MRVSIVTISFNQARFVEQTIRSVIEQDYDDIEYIIVDAGSTDGSRDIIEKYRDRITRVIFEPDKGPADGLNKGMAVATGEVLAFLNSDDILLPEAVSSAVEVFSTDSTTDLVYGNGYVIDGNNKVLRKVYADRFDLKRFAYGCVTFIQPSMFVRAHAFHSCGGFNILNTTCWDAELIADLALNGKRIMRVDQFFSAFRLHPESISGSARLMSRYRADWQHIFEKIMKREQQWYDAVWIIQKRVQKWMINPKNFLERVNWLARRPVDLPMAGERFARVSVI